VLEGADAFAASRAAFDALAVTLGSAQAGQRTHDQLEERLETDGRELLRLLLQDHLDLRALREQHAVGHAHQQGRIEPAADAEGISDRKVEPGHLRHLATVFGTVRITRCAWRATGTRNLCIPPTRLCTSPTGLRPCCVGLPQATVESRVISGSSSGPGLTAVISAPIAELHRKQERPRVGHRAQASFGPLSGLWAVPVMNSQTASLRARAATKGLPERATRGTCHDTRAMCPAWTLYGSVRRANTLAGSLSCGWENSARKSLPSLARPM
jgi:hypothetical protein